jgi:hypothetical protein
LKSLAEQNPHVTRLMTHPGIGTLTGLALVHTLGPVERFATARKVTAYVGLDPLEHSSDERQRIGSISKQGSKLLRYLMVEAGSANRMFVEGPRPSTHIRSRFPLHPSLLLWMERKSREKVTIFIVPIFAANLAVQLRCCNFSLDTVGCFIDGQSGAELIRSDIRFSSRHNRCSKREFLGCSTGAQSE